MYWGSVRFFKHLIFLALAIILLVPVCLAFYHMSLNARLTEELITLKAEIIADRIQLQQNQTESMGLSLLQNSEGKESTYNFDLEYQNLYPDLCISDIPEQSGSTDTVYLTFDDGPTTLTRKILDVLKEKEVRATFFIIGKNLETEQGKQILKNIVEEGHSVGIHTYSHVYNDIYNSVEDYLDDFYKAYDLVYSITGTKPEIFRFPGGSINGYNKTFYKELIAEMTRRGFVYYDWNVSAQDAVGKITEKEIYNNIVNASKKKTRSIILMHDSLEKKGTLKALPAIIDELSASGYHFEILTRNVAPVIFGYSD
ncbi:MAG: polysaccharide deacetylase [Clostridiales bacterium]|nr:polysaccharide deacetylase [Clostridiales bacterium]